MKRKIADPQLFPHGSAQNSFGSKVNVHPPCHKHPLETRCICIYRNQQEVLINMNCWILRPTTLIIFAPYILILLLLLLFSAVLKKNHFVKSFSALGTCCCLCSNPLFKCQDVCLPKWSRRPTSDSIYI